MDSGCGWKGTVDTLEDHLNKCEFVLVECPNECEDEDGDTNEFFKKDLDAHLEDCPYRDYECEYCGEEDTYAFITQDHDKVCDLKIVPCSNGGCHKSMQRQHLYQHEQYECEHTVVKCKHESIGCKTELKRKDMEAHEQDDKLHLHMAIDTVTFLKEQCSMLSYMLKKESMTFRLTEYQNKKENNEEFYSPSFYTGHGYYMNVWVYAYGNGSGEGSHVSVYAYFLKGKYDTKLKWPFAGTVTITLLNQERDDDHYENIMTISSTENLKPGTAIDNWGYPKYIPHSELNSKPYLRDDTLYFKVSVEVDSYKPWLEYTEK